MNYKMILEISYSDVSELYDVVFKSIEQLKVKMETDPKEISFYRLESMIKIFGKLQTRVGISFTKRRKITFSKVEALTLRYCLLHRRTTAGMGDLYNRIDSRIHPSVFERKEVSSA